MQIDPTKVIKALEMWKKLQEFISIVRGRLLVSTFFAAERRRIEDGRMWQDTFRVFSANNELFRENFLARTFTEAELEEPLLHILSIAEDDPRDQNGQRFGKNAVSNRW